MLVEDIRRRGGWVGIYEKSKSGKRVDLERQLPCFEMTCARGPLLISHLPAEELASELEKEQPTARTTVLDKS